MASISTRFEQYCQFKTPLLWRNVIMITILHLLVLYSLPLIPSMKISNFIFLFICGLSANAAISAGAHRLWTHRSYKATLPLRYFIMCCYMMAGQYSIVQWARDHRTHHKYVDTDADPHSAGRGLFFSHCGWLMMKRHPELKEKGRVIDVSDLWEDPVVRFHQKHFNVLMLLIHVIFPSAVSYFVFGETLKHCIFISFILRYFISLNILWCANSLSHYWGYRPYNKNISATQNTFLALLLLGEGWHNFHHTFPWDYRIGEQGQGLQSGAHVIDFFAWIGLAYDRKTASPEIIAKVKAKNDLPPNYEISETDVNDLDNILK